MDEARRAVVRLHLASGVGPRLYVALVERFGSAADAARASARDLASVPGIGPSRAARLRDTLDAADPEAELRRAEKAGVRLILRGDEEYPLALGYLTDAPPVLYVKGTLDPGDAQALGIVGMRRCSLYGCDQADRLAGGLARTGFTIVSGLARGIDAAAHQGALAAGGRTLAVLGNGLATVYPPEHRKLAEAVTESGALLSELPMTAEPRAEHFPRRNRILAGLSLGVIVVEAAVRSGSLITARLAAEMGKEVFAVPNRVDAPGAGGVHALLRDGARLVERAADVLEEFPDLAIEVDAAEDAPRQAALDLKAKLSPDEGRLVEVLDGDPMSLDALVEASGLEAARVSAAMTLLELKGFARALAGGRFAKR